MFQMRSTFLLALLTIVQLTLLGSPTNVYGQADFQTSPGSNLTGLIAVCTDPNTGQIIPYCNVTMPTGYFTFSGGHNHDDPSHIETDASGNPKYYGYTIPSFGNTDCCGLPFQFKPSWTGEQEFFQVCGDFCDTFIVDVKMWDLSELSSSPYHVRVGQTTWHPSNHWVNTNWSANVDTEVIDTVTQYFNEFGSNPNYQTVGVNDIAIEYGGIFDVCPNSQANCVGGRVSPWRDPHVSHRFGRDVDFRANGGQWSIIMDPSVLARFEAICQEKRSNLYRV